jgi:hypothetical protein
MLQLLRQEKLSTDDARRLRDWDACALARKLEADVALRGEVMRYETTWVLFVPRGTVAFRARALEAGTGRVLWRASARRSGFFASEERLSKRAAEALVRKLNTP